MVLPTNSPRCCGVMDAREPILSALTIALSTRYSILLVVSVLAFGSIVATRFFTWEERLFATVDAPPEEVPDEDTPAGFVSNPS